jgi:predicted SAM-dependent methyltransferase
VKLNIGCGKRQLDGYVNVDIIPTAQVVCDLNEDWPFDDESFDELLAMHVIEHLQDGVHFLNECWRLLKPGGTIHLETTDPMGGYHWSDPTHIRGYGPHVFLDHCQPTAAQECADYGMKMWSKVEAKTLMDLNYPVGYALIVVVDMVK